MPIEFTDMDGGKRVEDVEKKYAEAYGKGARVVQALPMWLGFVGMLVIAFMAGRQSVAPIEVEKQVLVDNVPQENLRRIAVLTNLLRAETGHAAPFQGIRERKTSKEMYVAFKYLDKWARSPTMDQSKDVEEMKGFMPPGMWERLK